TEPIDRNAGGSTAGQEVDPWDRYGWVMAAVWLIFLVFPIIDTVTQPAPRWVRAVTIGAILLFAAAYLRAVVLVNRAESRPIGRRVGLGYGAVLVALALVVGSAIGSNALGMVPFVVSLGMFSLRWREALLVASVCVSAAIAVPIASGVPTAALIFGPIVSAVALFTGTVRVLEDRSFEQRQHREELALATERDRVARDVHDVLGSSLTVVTVKAELAGRLVRADPARAESELAEIQVLTRQALAEIRATVAGLRTVRLSVELGVARSALRDAEIAAELPPDPVVVERRHDALLAWVLRESVTNVVRHSAARRCRVSLGPNWLEVHDDGKGIGRSSEGSGLRGLGERVREAGGQLHVDRSGPGTRIRVVL
ncbi:MAG: sensor histidine kinase, partial [Nocardioides sp.]